MRYLLAFLSLSLAATFASAADKATKPVDFNREIRPILSDTCFQCHGPDEKQRMVGLRLDTRDGAFAIRGKDAVVISGDSAHSRLYQRISHQNKAVRMPPANFARSLTDAQIALIKRWIDEGAKWETHWAFVPPVRQEPPAVKNPHWSKNPIDRFILTRLEKEGLKPSIEADKTTLLRRVTLDLTGLPPTPAEVDAFLADKSANAYEKVVDRLLASPRYGERMAMVWLDLARYADTHGYHIDSHRDMWPWRDWIIEAFNRNMPYDQFTIEQLAGDLLPHPTRSQKIATGFNRNHMINYEGGAIPEEYQNEYVVDRVETTSNVWLGLTMGCARCHDHKYDPIPQKDFYRFYSFFNTITEEGLDGKTGNAEPYLALATPDQERKLGLLQEAISNKEETMFQQGVYTLEKEWQRTRLNAQGLRSLTAPRENLLAHYEFEGNFSDSSGNYKHGRKVRGEPSFGQGSAGRVTTFNGETQVDFGNTAPLERDKPFSIAFWYKSAGQREMVVMQKAAGVDDRRGYELSFDDSEPLPHLQRGSHLIVSLVHKYPNDVMRVSSAKRLVTNDWAHFAVTYDGSGKAFGIKMYQDGESQPVEVLADRLTGSIVSDGTLQIGNKALGPAMKASLGDLRFYSRQLPDNDLQQLAVHYPIGALLFSTVRRTNEQVERLREYYLTYDAPEPLRALHTEIDDIKKEATSLERGIPTTMVMHELTVPRTTAVLGRGDYRNRGEVVTPAVPSVLPPMTADLPRNRLGLARWLVDPAHPLTARVAVNRFWQMYFGQGIVKTIEDFGSQGEAPVNAELLDWLATEFIRDGWDIKAMQKLIVTSAAYRQESKVTPELHEKDPENRLLARGPRVRLPAETVRDNALAVSGLLHEKLGGPSVNPYQPPGIWEELAFGEIYSAQVYHQSEGEDLYRRSMYTFWKRTAPPASLTTFDAPDREKCTARRAVTNTPLQALVLLNDPTYLEAARALAQHTLKEGGTTPAERIRYAFRRATSRWPSSAELRVLRSAAQQHVDRYRDDPAAAQEIPLTGRLGLGRRAGYRRTCGLDHSGQHHPEPG